MNMRLDSHQNEISEKNELQYKYDTILEENSNQARQMNCLKSELIKLQETANLNQMSVVSKIRSLEILLSEKSEKILILSQQNSDLQSKIDSFHPNNEDISFLQDSPSNLAAELMAGTSSFVDEDHKIPPLELNEGFYLGYKFYKNYSKSEIFRLNSKLKNIYISYSPESALLQTVKNWTVSIDKTKDIIIETANKLQNDRDTNIVIGNNINNIYNKDNEIMLLKNKVIFLNNMNKDLSNILNQKTNSIRSNTDIEDNWSISSWMNNIFN
eukprot:GHVL01035258.1.p1 GENE.GHVL01035258.1~~GHVL01035258.1.p1  ORF type:complete len:270 (-),score=91.91 GHVL01035258.1:15-824(-)